MAGWALEGEPVRGGYPPPGFLSLSGAEQVRAIAQGLIPRPPIFRLLGLRVSHASPGSATLTMPASPWHGTAGGVNIWPLVLSSLNLAARSVAPPGVRVYTTRAGLNLLRVPAIGAESFIGRGRVMLAGSSRITTEVSVEDAAGRLVAHAVGQSVTAVEDPPPPPAPTLARQEEPSYSTPDPHLRPFGDGPRVVPVGEDVVEGFRRVIASGERYGSPFQRLMGHHVVGIDEGSVEMAMPAVDWLASDNRSVAFAVPALLANAASIASWTTVRPGFNLIGKATDVILGLGEGNVGLQADGRDLRCVAHVVTAGDVHVVADAEIYDADGRLFGLARSLGAIVPASEATSETEERRALATVLFMDVVESTPTVERLGDAKWRELLEQNVVLVRREIQAAPGREIKTEGDGFLATFDLPAAAIRCARAVRDGLRRHGLEVRAGAHLGEIELIGADVAGIAVHVAKRVESVADPGTILVTSTVREAMSGSGLTFTSRGTHQLKGVSDEWHLYEVEGS